MSFAHAWLGSLLMELLLLPFVSIFMKCLQGITYLSHTSTTLTWRPYSMLSAICMTLTGESVTCLYRVRKAYTNETHSVVPWDQCTLLTSERIRIPLPPHVHNAANTRVALNATLRRDSECTAYSATRKPRTSMHCTMVMMPCFATPRVLVFHQQ